MAKKGYSAGDIIYLGKLENGKVTVLPVSLVALVSVSLDGELWKVRNPDSAELYNHFIQYTDDEEEADQERIVSQTPRQEAR